MITRNEILETNSMISDMNLDVRTITMQISINLMKRYTKKSQPTQRIW